MSEEVREWHCLWIVYPRRFSVIRIFHHGVNVKQYQMCLTKHLTYQALLKSSVKLNWSGWWTKSSKPEGPVTWKWHWLGGCTQVKAMTHVTLWITDQPLWVFSSKNTATAMRKRTRTQQPQQNGSCPQTWLPNTREQEPEPIYLMSLQKKGFFATCEFLSFA